VAPLTLPSVSSLLTGRYPEEIGIWSNESKLSEVVPTLATELRDRHWRTAAVVGNWVLRQSSGLTAGFEIYDDTFPQREVVRHWPERIAADTTDAALDALDEITGRDGEKAFLWVHYQDPHGPYTPPSGHRERHLERERAVPDGQRLLPTRSDQSGHRGIPGYQVVGEQRQVAFYRAGYRGEIEYTDEEIGRLLAGIEERGLDRVGGIVFAADHGEALGEGDYWFAHGENLTTPLVRVPLLIRIPGVAAGIREDVVSLVDLYPTLMNLLVEGDSHGFGDRAGRDLLAEDAAGGASAVYLATLRGSRTPRYGLIDEGYKFTVVEHSGVWDGTLVPRGRDGVDLSAGAPHLAAEMRGRLARFRKRFKGAPPEIRQEISPEDLEMLRALGYAGDLSAE
jgi:arylsulfatase A-like enzyme